MSYFAGPSDAGHGTFTRLLFNYAPVVGSGWSLHLCAHVFLSTSGHARSRRAGQVVKATVSLVATCEKRRSKRRHDSIITNLPCMRGRQDDGRGGSQPTDTSGALSAHHRRLIRILIRFPFLVTVETCFSGPACSRPGSATGTRKHPDLRRRRLQRLQRPAVYRRRRLAMAHQFWFAIPASTGAHGSSGSLSTLRSPEHALALDKSFSHHNEKLSPPSW